MKENMKERLRKLEVYIKDLHTKRVQGNMNKKQIAKKIGDFIKIYEFSAIGLALYEKSMAHGLQTAVSKPIEGYPSPYIVGFLYNRSWMFKYSVFDGHWKFALSKDAFTHISKIEDPEDPRIFTAENDYKDDKGVPKEMDIETADYILLKVFDAVIQVLEVQFEKEAEMEDLRKKK